MSRVGRCIDNGPMKGFWGILKCKMYYLNHFDTDEKLCSNDCKFIFYYNYERPSTNWIKLAPVNYRSLIDAA
ncbi:MAG: IS3 family transposase [Lawsonibacter sp.]|nr:IS3 family transposase [Lawsonibacter sp.]